MPQTWIGDLGRLLAFDPPGWGGALLDGLMKSLVIASGSYSLALLIGLVGACGKLYGGSVVRDIMALYTTLVRAVPELVLILLLYYAGTDAINRLLAHIGHDPIDINGLAAGIVVLGIVLGAYMIEVFRGAIQSIPPGEIEAGRSFGMPPLMLFLRIILPAMVPHALPALGNYWLSATRDTALLAVVGFGELTLATRTAASATQAQMTFFLTSGAIYLCVSIISSFVIKIVEARYSRGVVRLGAL
jgi:polar amino acid transport system permease protein